MSLNSANWKRHFNWYTLLWIACLVGLVSCQLKPSDGPPATQREGGAIRLSLSESDLALFSVAPERLAMEIANDASGEKGELIREESFAVEEGASYLLEDVTLGAKWFTAVLFGPEDRELARGEVRYVVTLGEQSLEGLVLVPSEAIPVGLKFAINISLNDFPGSGEVRQPEPIASFAAEARAILEGGDYSCLACHSAASPAAGLDMESYPYVSARLGGMPEIVAEISERVSSETRPMPSFPPYLETEEQQVVANWSSELNSTAPAPQLPSELRVKLDWEGETFDLASEDGVFVLTEANTPTVNVGTELEYRLRVFYGEAEIFAETYESQLSSSGLIEKTVTIDYEAPVINIPIVIGE